MHVDFNGYYNRVRVENAGPRDWVRSGAIAAGRRSVWLLGLYPHIYTCGLYITKGAGRGETSPKLSHCPPRYCNAREGGGLCATTVSLQLRPVRMWPRRRQDLRAKGQKILGEPNQTPEGFPNRMPGDANNREARCDAMRRGSGRDGND